MTRRQVEVVGKGRREGNGTGWDLNHLESKNRQFEPNELSESMVDGDSLDTTETEKFRPQSMISSC